MMRWERYSSGEKFGAGLWVGCRQWRHAEVLVKSRRSHAFGGLEEEWGYRDACGHP